MVDNKQNTDVEQSNDINRGYYICCSYCISNSHRTCTSSKYNSNSNNSSNNYSTTGRGRKITSVSNRQTNCSSSNISLPTSSYLQQCEKSNVGETLKCFPSTSWTSIQEQLKHENVLPTHPPVDAQRGPAAPQEGDKEPGGRRRGVLRRGDEGMTSNPRGQCFP